MNSKVPFFILQISRQIGIHGMNWRQYCNALKPQFQTINCYDIMNKSESCSVELVSQVNVNKNPQNNGMSAKDILDQLYNNGFTVPKFTKALKAMKVQLHQTNDSFSLKDDVKFIELCNLFSANCHKSSPFLLISALRNLMAFDLDPNTKVIEIVEKTILQQISKFDGNDMVECLMVLHYSKSITDTQKNIMEVLLNEIPNKLHDITSGSSVFKLVRVYDRFDKKRTRKLDFKLGELVKSFSVHYLCKLLALLSEKQCRNKTVLNAISYSIQNSESKPSLKQTTNILHDLSVLNFPDTDLLLHLTENRVLEISAASNPSLVSSLLTACGFLRWHHKEIMDACGSWILNNLNTCSSREFVSYILTAATLNYDSAVNTIKQLLPRLKKEEIVTDSVWLDVVWSLAILRCVDKDMLLGVLKKEFYEPLLDGNDSRNFRIRSNKLKLMNLKSVLKMKYPECVFSCGLFLDSVEVPVSTSVGYNKRAVVEALSNFVLPEKYMYTNHCTDMGITVDAEFIMSAKGKLHPLSEFGSKLKSPPMFSELLPPHAKRVAVLVLTHKDFTLNEPHVTGSISLATELLKNQGYVVVQIPYSEFTENLTIVKKVHYLKKKCMTAVAQNKM